MRKLVPISVVFALMLLISMDDYGVCSGSSMIVKAACSACHIGSVSGDIFIIDGKTEEDGIRLNENEYETTVRIPIRDFVTFQLNTVVVEEVPGKIEVDMATTLVELKNNSLFSISDLFQRKSDGNTTEDVTVRFTFDEKLTESKTVVFQGVLGNGDGTVEGDVAFYKEITLDPKESAISSSNLSFIQEGINYYPSHNVLEVVSLNKTEQLRVVDLQGKVVLQQQVESVASVDVSTLNHGYYIAVLGSTGKSMTSYKFKK